MSESLFSPSSALLSGALAGLLGVAVVAVGCSADSDPGADAQPSAGKSGGAGAAGSAAGGAGAGGGGAGGSDAGAAGYSNVVSMTPISYEEFLAKCDAWGGLVQTTATCAGNNACKGYSYLDGTLTEHSCKGLNGCGPGYSCVLLPKDQGRSGKELYESETVGCATTCHGQFEPDFSANHFSLYVRPDTITLEKAEERFKTGSKRRLVSIIGFGVSGVNDDGIAFHNMPGHYETLSLAEMGRVVDYIRTLPIETKYYEIEGATGAAGGAGAAGAAGAGGASAGAAGAGAGAGGASAGAAGVSGNAGAGG